MTGPAVSEYAVPARYVPADRENAADDVFAMAHRRPDRVTVHRWTDGHWRTVTARAFADEVTALAAGLMAAGIAPGDRVALMSATRYEWMLCDFAIWTAGAVTVPIYETSSPEQVAWILEDSGAVAAFVENATYAQVVGKTLAAADRIWDIDDGALTRLAARGTSTAAAEIDRRRHTRGAADPATIVYTSGTTGRPKGCVISHANLLAEVRNVSLADGIRAEVLTDRAAILLFLPLAHVFARVIQLCAVHNGVPIGHTSDIAHVADALTSYRPTLVLAVPRVFEKLLDGARRQAAESGHARLFRAAERAAVAYGRAREDGGPHLALRLRRALYDPLVYRRLRAALGGRITHAVSGGARLDPRIGHFLRGAGITVLEGYGLTETTAGVTFNLPDALRIGTVGRPLPGCAVRVDETGEVLVRGGVVFGGYWHDRAATLAVLEDGWLRTGDLGTLSEDGFLSIVGRKKELIVTASGKNVAPAVLEDRVRTHWLIDQCVVVGDARPYVAALISVDPEAFDRWKRDERKPERATVADLAADADLRAAVAEAVDEANRAVSRAEAIKRFHILPEPFAVGAELTSTQKVRRAVTLEKYAAEVTALYPAT